MSTLLIIISVGLIVFFIYKVLKPYFIKYDTTILFTGGLGSGKTLNSVKLAVTLYRKILFKWKLNCFKLKLLNKLFKKNYVLPEKPELISNIPICLNTKEAIYSKQVTKAMLTLKEKIPEYSVVLLDELPLLVNQFNWNQEEVKYYLCEFIALFRHYIGGYLVCNGQSESEIVKQVRAKLNVGYWCFNFQVLFKFFYRYKVIQFRISENMQTNLNEFVEENTKYTYGILPRKLYKSRCYQYRYQNIKVNANLKPFESYYTNDVIRFDNYISPCDDKKELK